MAVRPVDVGGSIAKGAQAALTLQNLAARKQAVEDRSRLRQLTAGGIPTDRQGRQQFVSNVAQVDHGMAMDWMKSFREMDAAQLDQQTYDQARAGLSARGLDISDLPEAFDAGQVNLARQGYGMLAGMKPGKLTERDKLRADLEAQGHNPEAIRGFMVNRDRYQFTVDQNGNRVLYDRYAGEPISVTGGTTPGAPEPAAAPAKRPAPGGLPTLTEGFEEGTGAGGFLKSTINTITDAVGAGLQFPQAEQAKQALNTMQTRTMLELAAMMPGKPSNLIRERLESIAVTPASVFEGDERALTKLVQTRGYIGELLGEAQDILDNPQNYSPKEVAAARAGRSTVRNLYEAYGHIINNWRPGSAGAPRITTKEQRDRLPPGARYVAPDGSVRVKK